MGAATHTSIEQHLQLTVNSGDHLGQGIDRGDGGVELPASMVVVGAGIAGMQASLDLANSDYNVYLVEQGPTIGGLMARLDKTFPTNDCTM